MYLENNLASKIQQSQHYTSERDVGGAVPYKCVAIGFVFQSFFYSIFKLRSGCDIGDYALGCVYTKYRNHTHALTQVLYSLFQNLSSYSLSRRACTCPQVSKRFLLIPKITTFVA